eukprot:CAMPEP_0194279760 /NCGR_PEP_ID=MMETSP0169-20130528/14111_1 /TAXON_ID=218684 /ORGANISM="Corethron pennatum, Strain L29A3" /LENGTH=287 /DNA_ID=CAMNT_0039024223 /DNA_START=28 /DNA_END=891 /DNA_ORIENTATION=-
MEKEDNRPLVKDLLEKHASKLADLRTILEKEESYSKEHYDDLWMLRFLLSHKKVSKASEAAISTMNYRKERKINELGDVRHKLSDHTAAEPSDRCFEIGKKFLTCFHSNLASMYALPDPDRGIVTIATPALIDQKKCMKVMSFEETVEVYLLGNEIIFQINDEITRRTGKLTKVLRILDMTDFSLKDFDRQYAQRDGAANKSIEDYYPGLLGTCIIINPPTWLNAVFKVVKYLFPKRFLEKITFVTPAKNPKDADYFLQYITRDKLWEKYGGNNPEWPPPSPSQLWK